MVFLFTINESLSKNCFKQSVSHLFFDYDTRKKSLLNYSVTTQQVLCIRVVSTYFVLLTLYKTFQTYF